MSLKPARACLATTLAATLLLAGCSSDDSDAPTKDAGDTTSETGAENPSDGADTSGTGTDLTADNLFQTILDAQEEAGSYRGTGSTTTAGMTIEQTVEVTFEDGEMVAHAQTTPASDQQVEVVLSGGVAYLRGDAFPVPAGQWVTIDSNDPEVANSPYGSFSAAFDPESALEVFDDPKELTLVGEESVDGVEARHYRVVVDSAAYGEAFDLPAEALSTLPDEMTFELWVDEEDRLVKQSQEAEIAGQPFSNEVTYTDYGADISVEVPAESDTVSITEIG